MILSKRVSLGNSQLDELDERIVITGIDEAAGRDTISAAASAAGDGQRITNIRRDTLDVGVRFRLLIHKDDMAAREALLEKINKWASNGGWLRVNYKPNRRILVTLAQAPGAGDMWQWTNEFTMTFRAFSVPYWEDDTETSATGATTMSGIFDMVVPGNTKTVMSVNVRNRSGMNIDTVSVSIEGRKLSFDGLRLGGSSTLTIDYEQTQKLFVVRIRIGDTSVMAARTPGSDDEFVVTPGSTRIRWEAQRAVQVTASCRGRYL